MAEKKTYYVARAFRVRGTLHEPGNEFTTDDAALLNDLVQWNRLTTDKSEAAAAKKAFAAVNAPVERAVTRRAPETATA